MEHWIENPVVELTSLPITSDVEALLALEADCVFFAGPVEYLDGAERQSGERVIFRSDGEMTAGAFAFNSPSS